MSQIYKYSNWTPIPVYQWANATPFPKYNDVSNITYVYESPGSDSHIYSHLIYKPSCTIRNPLLKIPHPELETLIDPETILPRVINNTRKWILKLRDIEAAEDSSVSSLHANDIIDALIASEHPLLPLALDRLAEIAEVHPEKRIEPWAFHYLARFMGRGSNYARTLLSKFDVDTLFAIAQIHEPAIGFLMAMWEFFGIEAAGEAVNLIKLVVRPKDNDVPEDALASAQRGDAYEALSPKKPKDGAAIIKFPKKKK